MGVIRVDESELAVAAATAGAAREEIEGAWALAGRASVPGAVDDVAAAELAGARGALSLAWALSWAVRARTGVLADSLLLAAGAYETAEAGVELGMKHLLGVGVGALLLGPALGPAFAGAAAIGLPALGAGLIAATASGVSADDLIGTSILAIAVRTGVELLGDTAPGLGVSPWTPRDVVALTMAGLAGAAAAGTAFSDFAAGSGVTPGTVASAARSTGQGIGGAFAGPAAPPAAPPAPSPWPTPAGSGLGRPISVTPVAGVPTSVRSPGEAPLTAAPSGYADMIDRIPPSVDGEAQVRITEYVDADGRTFYEVLVAGTSNQGLADSANPFDNAGNGAAYAGISEESLEGVRRAMAEAGIEPGDTVVLGAYSQGGLIAAHIAGSGEYDVSLLVAAGAPIGDIDTGSAPVVELVHDEDIIPALEGFRDPGQDDSILISRSVADDPRASSGLFGAHGQTLYVDTAQQIDESRAIELREAQAVFAQAYGDARLVSSETYLLERQ